MKQRTSGVTFTEHVRGWMRIDPKDAKDEKFKKNQHSSKYMQN